MRKITSIYLLAGWLFCLATSCKKYLDIVPPNTATIGSAFQNYNSALQFLYSLYSYMPVENAGAGAINACATDQAIMVWQNNIVSSLLRGEQSTSNPLFNYWEGKNCNPAISSFEGIRQCYIFLENVEKVPGVSDSEKTRWKGEATFLAAYYHYILLRQYGPIPIVDGILDFNATSGDAIYPKRQTYDSCVNYIARKFDEAAGMLPTTMVQNELGRITRYAVKAIKARMLLTAASPLFNGNSEYYSNFKGKDGEAMMTLTYDKEKWKRAADAIRLAIDEAEAAGKRLYQFSDCKNPGDAFGKTHRDSGIIATRYTMVDPWNVELIWGYSGNPEGLYGWQQNCAPLTGQSYNGIGPSLKTVETFYTSNGLPIDRDPTWNYQRRYEVDDNAHTLKLHLNREPRFYADVAYDRGLYYINGQAETMNFRAGEAQGWRSGSTNYSFTGYLVQKPVHPQTVATDNNFTAIRYPWPLIRLGELYLSYAEAMNEYYGSAQQGVVLDYLNRIRLRAGIPSVQDAWALAGHGASFTQDELRTIIRQERTIELMFEGQYFWDVRRWKQGNENLSKTVYGLNYQGADEGTFNRVMPVINRVFRTPVDYLFPISVSELSKNTNLIQNPGW